MEHLPTVAPKKNRSRAHDFSSSQQFAPHAHLSTSLLLSGNVSSVLTPIKESALPNQTRPSSEITEKQTEEQFNKELIDAVTQLLSKPNDRTVRKINKGFETIAGAKRQLMQDLQLSETRLKCEIAHLKLSSAPSTSENYYDLKHLLLQVEQTVQALKSFELTAENSATRQTPWHWFYA